MSEILTPESPGIEQVRASFKRPEDMKPGRVVGIVGPGNSGKTTLSSTVVESEYGGPMLIADCNSNANVLAGKSDIFVSDPIMRIAQFEKLLDGFEGQKADYKGIKTFSLDNVTALYGISLEENGGAKDARNDYKLAGQWLMGTTRRLLNLAQGPLRLNVIFVFQEAQETRVKVGEGSKPEEFIRQEISLSNKMQTEWPSMIPLMGFLRVGQDYPPYARCWDLRPINMMMAKFQIEASIGKTVPLEMWNPHLGHVFDALVGGIPFPTAQHNKPKLTPEQAKG